MCNDSQQPLLLLTHSHALLKTPLSHSPLLSSLSLPLQPWQGVDFQLTHTLALSLARRRCIIAWRADCCAATAGVAAAVARVLVLVLLFVVSLTCSQLLLQLLLLLLLLFLLLLLAMQNSTLQQN